MSCGEFWIATSPIFFNHFGRKQNPPSSHAIVDAEIPRRRWVKTLVQHKSVFFRVYPGKTGTLRDCWSGNRLTPFLAAWLMMKINMVLMGHFWWPTGYIIVVLTVAILQLWHNMECRFKRNAMKLQTVGCMKFRWIIYLQCRGVTARNHNDSKLPIHFSQQYTPIQTPYMFAF